MSRFLEHYTIFRISGKLSMNKQGQSYLCWKFLKSAPISPYLFSFLVVSALNLLNCPDFVPVFQDVLSIQIYIWFD